MSRRNISKKRFPRIDSFYNSYLVSLLINKILKAGKKTIAKRIVYQAFDIIKEKVNQDSLVVFKKAVKNSRPVMELKTRQIDGSNYKVPCEVSNFKSLSLALRWLIKNANERAGKTMAIKLADEIIDASNRIGNTIKEKERNQKMAESNRSFAHYTY